MRNFNFHKRGDKLLFFLALVVLTAALFPLAFKRAVGQGTVPPSIVFIQWWQEDHEKETLQELINEFKSLHNEFTIILKDGSYEDLRYDLFNPWEDPPGDIVALDPLWVPELLKRNVIEYVEAPLLSFINVLYYNTEILVEAGFTRPPKSRSEFLAYAKEVSGKGENIWGLTLGGNSSRGMFDDVYPWIWSSGAQLIRDGKPALTSRQVVESLSFLASLNSEGLIAPGALSFDTGKKLEDFISGRAAFMIAPAKEIELIRERMGDQAFSITSVPVPDNYAGRTFFAAAGWTAGIHTASAYKEEARLFIDFLAGKASFFSEKMPGNGALPSPDPFYSKLWDIAIAGESAQDFFRITREHELEEIFREELLSLFEGVSSPADAAASIQEKWERVLSRM